jgi:regulator of protease activity HflC (stomatin/prohibitin superfamily)
MKRLPLIVFLTFLTLPVLAQSADQYFHNGAQYFINADLQTSLNYVEEGLMEYPNDRKLNALYEKLKEEQEKQQQQQQENQEEQGSEGEEQSEQSPQEVNPEDLQSQQISKEEAEKILRALAQKEKELLKEFKKKKSTGSAKHEKDW